jgi:hypothetical protein
MNVAETGSIDAFETLKSSGCATVVVTSIPVISPCRACAAVGPTTMHRWQLYMQLRADIHHDVATQLVAHFFQGVFLCYESSHYGIGCISQNTFDDYNANSS